MTESTQKSSLFKTSFYGIVSLLIFTLAMTGFSTTYFAPMIQNSFSHSYTYIHVHAITATLWLLVYIVQTHLVVQGHRGLHIKLGKTGALIAFAFLITGGMTFLAMVKTGLESDNEMARFNAEVLSIAPVVDLTLFALLAGFGLKNRKKPQVHKRLMYLASCLFITPGMFRLVRWLVGEQPTPENGGLAIPLVFTLFVIAGPIHDKIKFGKIDRTYWWALPVWAMVFFAVPASIETGFWAPVAHWVAAL